MPNLCFYNYCFYVNYNYCFVVVLRTKASFNLCQDNILPHSNLKLGLQSLFEEFHWDINQHLHYLLGI